jgi:hypothetical protein
MAPKRRGRVAQEQHVQMNDDTLPYDLRDDDGGTQPMDIVACEPDEPAAVEPDDAIQVSDLVRVDLYGHVELDVASQPCTLTNLLSREQVDLEPGNWALAYGIGAKEPRIIDGEDFYLFISTAATIDKRLHIRCYPHKSF